MRPMASPARLSIQPVNESESGLELDGGRASSTTRSKPSRRARMVSGSSSGAILARKSPKVGCFTAASRPGMVAVCQSQFFPPGWRRVSDFTMTRLTSALRAAARMSSSGSDPSPPLASMNDKASFSMRPVRTTVWPCTCSSEDASRAGSRRSTSAMRVSGSKRGTTGRLSALPVSRASTRSRDGLSG